MGRRRAMPNRDVEMNQGLLRGASYYPTDLLGSPVDLINMALKPMGLGSQKPVMGSEYLQSLAQQYGLSQQPTGSNAENVARLAISAMNPATGARAVGKVIEPTMQALGPKAYGLLEDYMVKTGGMIPLTAYHGTPHTIQGKFDINRVGTGEGAQAYGHGMYFAENPAVAKEYVNQLQKLEFPKASNKYEQAIIDELNAKSLNDPVQAMQNISDNFYSNRKDLEEAVSNIVRNSKPTGNLYKVDIPDADIPMMLDWDKPLTQQSSEVRKALAQYMDGSDTFISPVKGSLYNPTGKQIYEAITKDTDAFSGKGSKIASEQLNQLGVKGIRYLDEGSRGVGKGTSNYVVFDPTDVKILEKNENIIEGLLD
jgi:hypothetical protein